MALVSTSQVVTDQSAVPPVKVNALEKGGVVRTAQGYLAAASVTGGTTGQWYTFVRIPVRARVLGVFLSCTTTTTGAVKVGLYRPDGIAIDDDCFQDVFATTARERARMDDLVVYTAALRDTDLATSFATAISTAGAQSDAEVDIALAIVTVIGTPVDMFVEVDYVLPD